jgi:peptide/nickel transport system ATP-binding protein
VVEFGDADDVLLRPHHPYTKKLVASLPVLERPAPTTLNPRPITEVAA